MAPISERSGVRIRPCPPMEFSSTGFLAHMRVASTSQRGLLWSYPPESAKTSITALRPDGGPLSSVRDSDLDQLAPVIEGILGARARASGRSQGGIGEAQMRDTIRSLGKHSWDLESYLDGVHKSKVLGVIASSGLTTPSSSGNSRPVETDNFVRALARWFKSDYMRWIDPIPCPTCRGATRAIGGTEPTPAERADGGGRVELHQCSTIGCGAVRRFVRYGHIGALLRTREGRCGEWAHLFYAFLRVAGVEARYVWNSEDHVWVEFWSSNKEHWVHVDPCEAAVDEPLLYDKGWGKKQAFCLAFGPRGAEDVTAVYVVDHAECLVRRRAKGWKERTLALALEQHTISLQLQHPAEEIPHWDDMIRKQHKWKSDVKRRMAEEEEAELGGRVSGPEEWRKMRDEMGEEEITLPTFTVKKELHNLKLSDVYLFGDATRSGTGVVLTTRNSQTSGVFADIQVSQNASFRASLTFRMFAPPGAGEADGMAIVFSQHRKLGLGGYGLGYSGLGGNGDFVVEIDTYRTQDHADDPPAPHVSVHSPPDAHHRNSIACTKPGQAPYLSDGRVWTLELVFEGASRRLVGILRGKDETSAQGKTHEVGLWQIVVPVGNGGAWYVGVTGSCGGLWQKQEVLDWRIDEIDVGLSDAIPQ